MSTRILSKYPAWKEQKWHLKVLLCWNFVGAVLELILQIAGGVATKGTDFRKMMSMSWGQMLCEKIVNIKYISLECPVVFVRLNN